MDVTFVSVIVPVKNGERDLPRLLASLARLAYPRERFEIIVCDNGSTDRTVEEARRMACQVLEAPELTVAGVRNAGARVARGDVLAFVDADCTVSPCWLDAAVSQLKRTRVVAAGCYPGVPEAATWVQRLWNLKERVKPVVHEAAWLPSMNLVVDRAAFDAAGGFDAELSTCEDVDLCYRLRDAGGGVIWDERIGVTHHGEPATLAILFKKERWHGSSNLHGYLRHALRKEEVPSLVLPVVVLGSWTIPAALLLSGPLFPLLAGPFLAIPPSIALAGAVRTAARARRPGAVPGLSAVYLVYLAARAVALTDEWRAWSRRRR